jgi:hypothetical protein
MRTEFKAPWAVVLWVITIFSTIVIFALPLTVFRNLSGQVLGILVPIFLGLWTISCLLTIRGYRVARNTLYIRRLAWETKVDIADFEDAEVLPPGTIGAQVRLFGNGGLFSFSGWYWSKKLGRYRMWVTDPKLQLVLNCRSRKIVVSPDAPEEFIRAVRHHTR